VTRSAVVTCFGPRLRLSEVKVGPDSLLAKRVRPEERDQLDGTWCGYSGLLGCGRSRDGLPAVRSRSLIAAAQRWKSSRNGACRPGMTSSLALGMSAAARWPMSGGPYGSASPQIIGLALRCIAARPGGGSSEAADRRSAGGGSRDSLPLEPERAITGCASRVGGTAERGRAPLPSATGSEGDVSARGRSVLGRVLRPLGGLL
jgi:hypothetical protein